MMGGLANFVTRDDAEQQGVVMRLVQLSYDPKYNHAFEDEDYRERCSTLSDLYGIYCCGGIRKKHKPDFESHSKRFHR